MTLYEGKFIDLSDLVNLMGNHVLNWNTHEKDRVKLYLMLTWCSPDIYLTSRPSSDLPLTLT